MNRNRTIIKRKQFFEYRYILIAMLLSYTLYTHNYVAEFFYFSATHIDRLLVAHPHSLLPM